MAQEILNRFGVCLAEKELELKRKITRQEVADATGLDIGTIDRYARNQVTRFDAPVMLALCNYFGITNIGDFLVIKEVEDAAAANDNPLVDDETLLAMMTA